MIYSTFMSPFSQQYNDEDLIQWFKALAGQVGRTPTQQDIRNVTWTTEGRRTGPSVVTLYRRFGNLSQLARLAGLEPRARGYGGRVA